MLKGVAGADLGALGAERPDRRGLVRRVPTGGLTGRGRIWGSSTLRYRASLDPGRLHKKTALILDNGQRILPFITPDDPAAAVAAIREHSTATIVDGPPVIR